MESCESIRRFVVFDIGKTNTRAILADLASGQEIETLRMENRVLPGPPYPHLDVEGLWLFLMQSLREFATGGRIGGVIVIAHGATFALIDDSGLVLPVLDYEFAGPDELAEAYDRLRPPFERTGTPRMPGGLNIGAQLFWLRSRFQNRVEQAQHALFWPQYWTWRLTGRAVSEISYASSHGDVWDLRTRGPVGSAMADVTGGLFPDLAPAHELAGVIRSDLAHAQGLPEGIPVHVGAHDSSLALVPHAGAGKRAPLVVMPTGTWLTAFAIGVERMPAGGMPGVMASLDIFGHLVPNFRFMAGKARADLLAATDGDLPTCPEEYCELRQEPESGQFRLVDARTGKPVRLAVPEGGRKADHLDRLLAREAIRGMQAIGARGPVHMTGPFAGNRAFTHAMEKHWPFSIELRSYEESLVEQVTVLFREAGR